MLLFIAIVLFTGCSDLDAPDYVKTEFKLHENASIDNYTITMTKNDAVEQYNGESSIYGQYLIVTFEITNHNTTVEQISEDNFYLEVDDRIYSGTILNDGTIGPNQSKEITIVYDVPREDDYELLFYSGVVGNNIEFDIELW